MTQGDDGAATGHQQLAPGDPGLRDAMMALVGAMVAVAGSNRRLSELSGVSEATVRNYRRGIFPRASIATAVQLDTWAAGAVADDPGPGEPGSLSDSLTRWQGRSLDLAAAAEPDLDPHPDPGTGPGAGATGDPAVTPRSARRRRARAVVPLLATAVVALSAAVAVLLAGALDDGSTQSGVADVRVDRDLPLTDDNFCSWSWGRDPIPLVSADPLVMRVDARCNAPAERDPVKDVGTSVYAAPTNDGAEKVGTIRSGNTFVPECWARSGDHVEDASPAENRSAIWIRAVEPAGFLPDVNVGGGYSEEQLLALGLDRC